MRAVALLTLHLASLIGFTLGANVLGGNSFLFFPNALSESTAFNIQVGMLMACPYIFAFTFHQLLNLKSRRTGI
jgi:hypothetical protein